MQLKDSNMAMHMRAAVCLDAYRKMVVNYSWEQMYKVAYGETAENIQDV